MKLSATLGKWLDMPVGASREGWKRFWGESALAYLFLLPTLLVLGAFVFYPLVKSFYMSLHDWPTVSFDPPPYVGLKNYRDLLHDDRLLLSLKNTLIYVIGTVPLGILLSLGVAVLLNNKIRFRGFYRLAFFTPYITNVIAISIVWMFIFHEQYGLLNSVLGWVGIHPQKWLLDPKWTMFNVIVISLWKTIGYNSVIFLAGLQNVDKELYNAAKVDGANDWQAFWKVTWPLLTPTTFFISITSVIASFKVFSELYVLYNGAAGPVQSGMTMVFLVFEALRKDFNAGYASAAAWVLFFLVMVITLLQLWYARKRVHYS